MLRGLPDLLPEFVASGAGLGGEGKQAGHGIFLRQGAESAAQLIVREAVAFGGDEQEFAVGGGEEVQQLAVALLRRDVGIDQDDAQAQRGALVEIGLDEFGPFLGNLARNLGVAVAGEVGENQLRARLSGPADLEEVDGAGAARVELVRATLSPTSELMTLDLPTLERPRKAISGRLGAGNWAASVADAIKRERTLMLKFATREGPLASEATQAGVLFPGYGFLACARDPSPRLKNGSGQDDAGEGEKRPNWVFART